jgi:hypothetical protein
MWPGTPLGVISPSQTVTGAPLVVVPYVPRFLRAETVAAVPGAHYVDVSGDHQAYWRLLRDLWDGATTFIIVEHDIVPLDGQIQELWNCPSVWDAAPYRMDAIVTTALGLVKFGSDLLLETQDLMCGILDQYRVWSGLDSMVIAELHRRGYSEHVHQPPVRHLHEPAPPPEPRRPFLARLHYIGDGTRYINGIPAADFETWDAIIIAQCLESGLYVSAGPPRRAREPRDIFTKVETPDLVTKVIPVEAPASVTKE